MGVAFHQLCPRYSGTLTPTAPTDVRLWETFTFFYLYHTCVSSKYADGHALSQPFLIRFMDSFNNSVNTTKFQHAPAYLPAEIIH